MAGCVLTCPNPPGHGKAPHLFVEAGVLTLAGGGRTAGGGRLGVAVFPAAVAVAGVVAVFLRRRRRGGVVLPLVGAPAVVTPLSGGRLCCRIARRTFTQSQTNMADTRNSDCCTPAHGRKRERGQTAA